MEDSSRCPGRGRDGTDGESEGSQAGGGYSQLERVASGGRLVVFVALQGERRNANVKVGTVGPLDAKGPPEHKEQDFNPGLGLKKMGNRKGEYVSEMGELQYFHFD